MPGTLLQLLTYDGGLLERDSEDRETIGLLPVDNKILMMAIAPILRSDDTGPSRGSIMIGRYLDQGKLEDLRRRTQLDISYEIVAGDAFSSEKQSIISALGAQAEGDFISLNHSPTMLRTIDADRQVGYLLMPDVAGDPLLLWSVNIPRDIYKQGTISLRYLFISMAIIGFVLIGGIVVLLERLVLKRLARLSGDVSEIGESNDLASRVVSNGNDELGHLGKSVNWMLEQLQKSEKKLVAEHERAEGLLLNILPASIVDQLKNTHEPIADYHEEVTVLFADIVGFTTLSASMEAVELVSMLNDVFSRFDDLANDLGLEKIKTIGDAYMVAAGLPELRSDHAEAIAEMALCMREGLEEYCAKLGEPLQIRIGINTGVVVAGVIGKRKFIYDLWGDAVNVASRMESSGEPGMIQVTEATFAKIRDKFLLEPRGVVDIKGRGKMKTYLLTGRKRDDAGDCLTPHPEARSEAEPRRAG